MSTIVGCAIRDTEPVTLNALKAMAFRVNLLKQVALSLAMTCCDVGNAGCMKTCPRAKSRIRDPMFGKGKIFR